MPVSGVVVTCRDGLSEAVAAQIGNFAGVDVHGILPDGQLVAVIEAETVQGEVNLVSQLNDVDGVMAVRLAYHNFEDLETE